MCSVICRVIVLAVPLSRQSLNRWLRSQSAGVCVYTSLTMGRFFSSISVSREKPICTAAQQEGEAGYKVSQQRVGLLRLHTPDSECGCTTQYRV
jgi:hypothetical protein